MTDPTCIYVVHSKLKLQACFSMIIFKISAVKMRYLTSFQMLHCQSHKNIFKAPVDTSAEICYQWQRLTKLLFQLTVFILNP